MFAQQDFSKVEIKTEKLSATTYMMVGAGGNENMGKAGALIVAHENVRKRMSTEQFMEFMNITSTCRPAHRACRTPSSCSG